MDQQAEAPQQELAAGIGSYIAPPIERSIHWEVRSAIIAFLRDSLNVDDRDKMNHIIEQVDDWMKDKIYKRNLSSYEISTIFWNCMKAFTALTINAVMILGAIKFLS